MPEPLETLRRAAIYGSSSARLLGRRRPDLTTLRRGATERLIFVVGSPRSGTTFLGGALGAQAGAIDLGEVKPLKAAVPELVALPEERAGARLRRTLELVRGLGLVRDLRGVEQTPETAFVLAAALRAYPQARAVHALRDGRDVVCSLLEQGWLSAGREGRDDALLSFGAHPRFWVEPERRDEFARASDATRAAWAWRRYVEAARRVSERTLELRYEQLVAEPSVAAERLAEHLALEPGPLAETLEAAHGRSVGRWRTDLSEEQLADVEREAGPLLRELGYE
jgi:hypothetical protein